MGAFSITYFFRLVALMLGLSLSLWSSSALGGSPSPATWVTWEAMQNASQPDEFLDASGTLPAGGRATATINGASAFSVIIDIPAAVLESQGVVVFLTDTDTANYTWDSNLTMRVGVSHYNYSWRYHTGYNSTEFGSATAPSLVRMRKSGNDVIVEESTNDGGSWSTLGTLSGVLAGAGTLYLKALFLEPNSEKKIRAKIE